MSEPRFIGDGFGDYCKKAKKKGDKAAFAKYLDKHYEDDTVGQMFRRICWDLYICNVITRYLNENVEIPEPKNDSPKPRKPAKRKH